MNAWYATLNRPPLTPPDWLFGPVWTVLYAMIVIAIVLYFRAARKPNMRLTVVVLAAHLASNFIWTWLFFGLQAPAAALVDIVFLDISLVVVIVRFRKVRPLAALLLVPYLVWVLFATYLNLGFLLLN